MKTRFLFAIVLFVAATVGLRAQKIETLYSFNETNGGYPESPLTIGKDGTIFGSTALGGAYNCGTIFQFSTNGTLTTLVSFDGTNGSYPFGQIVQAGDGYLYGTTWYGGIYDTGTIYRVSTTGDFKSLHSFNYTNGAEPVGGLTLATDGQLYGTTYRGGSNEWKRYGTVFRINTNGLFESLMSFSQIPWLSGYPYAALVATPDGYLYGTATMSSLNGKIFKVSTNGVVEHLVWKIPAGLPSMNSVIPNPDGSFYGSAICGGYNSSGSLFCVTTNSSGDGGTANIFFEFSITNGHHPRCLTRGPDGNIYGLTSEGGSGYYGVFFRITPDNKVTLLCSFDGTKGKYPFFITLGPDGCFYGTTRAGGEYNCGTIYRITLPPVIKAEAKNGQTKIQISTALGQQYGVQYTTNLSTPIWKDAFSVTNTSTNSYQFLDDSAPGEPVRFYRAFLK